MDSSTWMPRSRRTGATVGVLAVLALAGCAGSPASEPSTAATTATAETAEAAPVVYDVPAGCPDASQLGTAYLDKPDAFGAVGLDALSVATSDRLPDGGCAYVSTTEASTDSGDPFRMTYVFYFRLDEGSLATQDLLDWGTQIGGYAAEGATSMELPSEFSGFTNASLDTVDGVTSHIFRDTSPIPEFTTGASGWVMFALPGDVADGLLAGGVSEDGSSTSGDPTTMLAQGAPALLSGAFSVQDPDGYTADFELAGSVSPFEVVTAQSKPGQFEAATTHVTRATITNTTAGRDTRVPATNLYLVYPKDDAICASSSGTTREGDEWSDKSYCLVLVGSTPETVVPADGASTVESPEGMRATSYGPLDEAAVGISVMNAPLSAIVTFGGNPGMTASTWTGTPGCGVSINGGTWAVTLDGWPDLLCL